MVFSTRSMAASLVAVGTLALAGCSNDPVDEPPTQAPTSGPVTTTEAAPTTVAPTDDRETTTAPPELSAEEQDEVDIEESLRLYTRALDDAFNGDASIEGIYPFSRDTAREKWVTEVLAAEAQGVTSSGLTGLEILEVSVAGDTAKAVACADVSELASVDENGDSVIAEERLNKTLQEYVLERDDSAGVGWYITEDTNRNEPCDG